MLYSCINYYCKMDFCCQAKDIESGSGVTVSFFQYLFPLNLRIISSN